MAIFDLSEPKNWNQSIASRVVTRASRSATQESEQGKMTRGIFGPSLPASFAWFDRDSRSWKTSQATFLLGLEKFSETWPDSGTMRNGVAFERLTSEPPTFESGFSLWPTCRASSGGGNTSAYPGAPYRPALAQRAQNWPTAWREDGESAGNHPGASDSLTGVTGNWVTPTTQGANLKGDAEIWATSQAHDSNGGNPDRVGRFGTEHGGRNLSDDVTLWGTPQSNPATHNARPVDHGKQLANQADNWATPDANRSSYSNGLMGPNIREQATQWQTPATDAFRSRGGDRKQEMGLDQQARFFSTPSSRDWKSEDASNQTMARNARPLNEVIEHWNTPHAPRDHDSDHSESTYLGRQVSSLQHLPTQVGPESSETSPASARPSPSKNPTESRLLKRRLNPRFVEWLMGLPIGWTEVD